MHWLKKIDPFDILKRWKTNTSKNPVRSKMARNVLSVPVSTLASESSFSTGGWILDSYRSSLRLKTVAALVCAQNWFRSRESMFDLRYIITKLESVEEIASGMYSCLCIFSFSALSRLVSFVAQ